MFKFIEGLSKSAIYTRLICVGIWILYVCGTVYTYAEFVNYEITGYNVANFFETKSLIYSLINILTSLQPHWIICAFIILLFCDIVIYEKIIKKDIHRYVYRVTFVVLFTIACYFYGRFYMFLFGAMYSLTHYGTHLPEDLRTYFDKKDTQVRTNYLVALISYSILLNGTTLYCLWNASYEYELKNGDFTKYVCQNVNAVAVLDKTNSKHVGWHVNTDDTFITIKEKINNEFYEMVSINKSEIVSVQSFSLEFASEKRKAFVECRNF